MGRAIHGRTDGLSQLDRDGLQRLYRYQTPPERLVGDTLGARMCALSARMGRQVGLLVDRRGSVSHVIVGDDRQIFLPDVGRLRATKGRLRGVRLIHTHLKGEGLTDDDMTDLARLGLDLVCAITVHADGRPDKVHVGHIVPTRPGEVIRDVRPHEVLAPMPWPALSFDALATIRDLEVQLTRSRPAVTMVDARERALLVHVGTESQVEAEDRLDELAELARTARVEVLGRVVQRRRPDRDTVLGKGRLQQVILEAMQADAGLLIFDHELSPAQMRGVTRETEMKVLDRTQLILDIFASRARSRDGKIKVELAQLKYNLPRLSGRDDAMSRLTGGIGGVGPGETKLEIDRRRARDRIHKLGQILKSMAKGRDIRRGRRRRGEVLSVCLVGYTNVGKSSLLNALCKGDIFTEDLLFATLDPTTRRIRLPSQQEVVITDTVGFIRDLPKELMGAFEATLEEAQEADLLLLVADASHAQLEDQLRAVERILHEHGLDEHRRLLVLNKADQVLDHASVRELSRHRGGLLTSCVERTGLTDLMAHMGDALQLAAEERGASSAAVEEWHPLA